MDRLFQLALGNAAMAAALALLAAAASAAFRRPALTRALWIVVLLKLLTPPLWLIPVHRATSVPPERSPAGPAGVAVTAPAEPQDRPPAVVPHELVAGVDMVDVAASGAPAISPAAIEPAGVATIPTPPAASVAALAAPPPSPASPAAVSDRPARTRLARVASFVIGYGPAAAGGLWLVGSAAYAAAVAAGLARFRRLTRDAAAAPPEVRRRAEALAARLGLRRCPAIRVVAAAVPPMLCPFGVGGLAGMAAAPVLLLPAALWERLDAGGRDAVLAHELAHLRRRDHWVRVLELLASVLYWWHPAVWWARRELREATEQCCDAWVLWALPRSGGSYAAALLDAIDFLSTAPPTLTDSPTPAPVPALASGMGQFSNLRRRLLMIQHANVRRALSWPGAAAVCGLAAALLPLSPGLARSAPPSAPPAVTPADSTDQPVDKPADKPENESARPDEPPPPTPAPAITTPVSVAPAPVPAATPASSSSATPVPAAGAPVAPIAAAAPPAVNSAPAAGGPVPVGVIGAAPAAPAGGAYPAVPPTPSLTPPAANGTPSGDVELDRARAEVRRLQAQLRHAQDVLASLERQGGNGADRPGSSSNRTPGNFYGTTPAPQSSARGAPRAAGAAGSATPGAPYPFPEPRPAPADPRAAEDRLDALEQQVGQILRELRQLKQEMRPADAQQHRPQPAAR